MSWSRANAPREAGQEEEEAFYLFWTSQHICGRYDGVCDNTLRGFRLSALVLMKASEAGVPGGQMSLLLLLVLAEVLSGDCVPRENSGKYRGSWRWKGDRSRE